MFKRSSVLIILLIFCILMIIGMILSIIAFPNDKNTFEKDLTIDIGDEFTLITEEIYFPKITGRYMDFEIQENIIDYSKINVFIADREIKPIGNSNVGLKFLCKENKITIGELNKYFSFKNNKITIKYYVENHNLIEEYNNISILNIKYLKNFIYGDIVLKTPITTNEFSILGTDKILGEKISENEYLINGKEMRKDIKIIMDSQIFNNTLKFNYDYKINNILYNKMDDILILLVIFITFVNICKIFIITKKRIYDGSYYRNTEDVVDIMIAEYMIDKKINSNNLIMSIIVQQIVRGNIEYKDNNLILKRHDRKSKIKNTILAMFFETSRIISIKNLFTVFSDEMKAKKIVDDFKDIKNKINDLFYKYDLFNKQSEKKLKEIRIIARILIYITIGYLIYILYGIKFSIFMSIIFLILGSLLYITRKLFIGIFNRASTIFVIPILYSILIICGYVIKEVMPIAMYSIKITELVMIIIIILINCMIIKKSKMHVFSERGFEEYKKIKGLKDYIIDYSLMKERDIGDAIIWDDYLTYATAFGIPNKVTEKFSESLMKHAEVIEKINKVMLG